MLYLGRAARARRRGAQARRLYCDTTRITATTANSLLLPGGGSGRALRQHCCELALCLCLHWLASPPFISTSSREPLGVKKGRDTIHEATQRQKAMLMTAYS